MGAARGRGAQVTPLGHKYSYYAREGGNATVGKGRERGRHTHLLIELLCGVQQSSLVVLVLQVDLGASLDQLQGKPGVPTLNGVHHWGPLLGVRRVEVGALEVGQVQGKRCVVLQNGVQQWGPPLLVRRSEGGAFVQQGLGQLR